MNYFTLRGVLLRRVILMEEIMNKKLVFIAVLLCLIMGLSQAKIAQQGTAKQEVNIPVYNTIEPGRIPPTYTFSRIPNAILTSYYDYMIGSYNALPVQLVPDNAGGGYMMTYHGQRTPTGQRRAFYTYVDASGNMVGANEITNMVNREGYPTVAVDPVSGKPLYAWHANTDTDPELEVQFTSDAFFIGIPGLFNDLQTIINNPISIQNPSGNVTTDNEFIWPSAVIGPSPVANKRRVYVVARNSITHSYGPSENPYIAYADFNGDDIENGIPLIWSYTSIPEMNGWNTGVEWRRPFHAITCDTQGNLYYAGYHFATTSDGVTNINEADMDVFKCSNYGQGTWTRVSAFSDLPSWNPASSPGGVGYFANSSGTPYANNQLTWAIANSSHLNATVDDLGRIHFPATFALGTSENTYYPLFQVMKEVIFNPTTNQFTISEIYPRKNPADTYNQCFQPWDRVAPWGVPEYVNNELSFELHYPFPHWNDTLHDNAMLFHYNNVKITQGNGEGMLAAVWQDSQRARLYNSNGDPNYVNYANTPEICISVSSDNGNHWSDPIVLNNVETAQFAGLKPMWVYPAHKVKFVGMQGNQKVGKLGLMFYNDYTWGSYAITPPAHPNNDGGQVMFTELQIVFPEAGPSPTDPFGNPVILSGSMAVMTGVMIDNQMASAGDVVAAFVNVGGTPQLRGKGTVQINSGVAGCLLQVFTENNGENIFFKVWDASVNQVLDVAENLASQVNGTVGSWPDNLFWLHAGSSSLQNINLQTGWNMISLNVHPNNMAISSIFASIIGNVLMVKSPEGVYEPGNPYSTLTQMADRKGYYVKVTQPCILSVTGAPIDVSIPIAMQTGWNLVAYTPQSAMPVATAVASIAANLLQVKGTEGIYEPGNPYSTLSTLSPGRAYWMKLSSAANLIYPASGRDNISYTSRSTKLEAPVLKTNSQSILISLDDCAQTGDILMAFVGEELRGIAEVMEVEGRKGVLLQIFSEEFGEQIDFRLKAHASPTITNLYPGLQSEPGSILGDYATGLFYSLSAGTSSTPELITTIGKAWPNPFQKGTNITLNIAKDSAPIKVEIFNIKGQKVKTLLNGTPEAGSLLLWWDGTDDNGRQTASGVYFCRLQDGKATQSLKLMLVK